jgi:hypothetical protein
MNKSIDSGDEIHEFRQDFLRARYSNNVSDIALRDK